MLRAAVPEIVAVDARDHDIGKTKKRNCFCQMPGLLGIRRERPAVRHVAERAAARADVAEDHESRGALAEALGDVRAGGFLAHRVQLLAAQDVLDLGEARVGAWRAHADPRRLRQRRRFFRSLDELDRLSLAFVLYPSL